MVAAAWRQVQEQGRSAWSFCLAPRRILRRPGL